MNIKIKTVAAMMLLALKILIDNTGANTLIEVDGGVNDVIGKRLAEAGADVLVAGSYIFNAPNPLERIDSLYKL